MKIVFCAAAFTLGVAGLVAGGFSTAHADGDDLPRAGWLSIKQIADRLHGIGYRQIAEIEAEDGVWKAKAVKNGIVYKIKLNPHSGRVIERRVDDDDD